MKRHIRFRFFSSAEVVALIALLVLSYQFAALVQIPAGHSRVVSKGSIQHLQCSDLSTPLTEWKEVNFPRWEMGIEEGLHCMRMRTTLSREDLSVDIGPAKLMVNALSGLGRIWLNGKKIDEVIHSTSVRRVLWLRPYSVVIPAHLVQDSNILEFEYFNYLPTLQIGQMLIAGEPLIEDKIGQVGFISKTTLEASSVLFGIIGTCLISFSIVFTQERLMRLSGTAMMCWALLTNLQIMVEVPSDYYLIWQALQYLTISCAAFAFVDFLKILSDINSNKLLIYCRNIYGYSGFALCIFFGNDSIYYLDIYWVGSILIYYIYIMAYCFFYKNLLQKNEGEWLAIQSAVTLILMIHDFMINSGTMELLWAEYGTVIPPLLAEEIYLMQFGATFVLAVMGIIVFNRYRIVQSYGQAEANRLEKALHLSEARLRDAMQKQQKINNIRLIQSERERLLMEIHDGVGSQLISGMLLAKKQKLNREAMLDMFQVCMDDVKVIIDCISLGKPANAAVMIGLLLERQRQRLAGLGITLRFKADQKHNATHPEISDAQCLHSCRIVQECIANAIKYAQCSVVTVHLRQYHDHLLVVVRDNGTGLPSADTIKLGRGLMNMRKRARLLSGQIRFLSKTDGFRVMLRFKNATTEDWQQAA
jgi:signal transduction histidine kinase